VLGLVLATALAAPPPAAAQSKKDLEQLALRHREWLADVRLLIPAKERKEFLALASDYQRDAFIRRFWEARDPHPDTTRNEFREEWYARLEIVRDTYGNDDEDQARLWLLQGPPDGRFEWDCTQRMWQLEVWLYAEPAGVAGSVSWSSSSTASSGATGCGAACRTVWRSSSSSRRTSCAATARRGCPRAACSLEGRTASTSISPARPI
jgi:GWxTD domain-containing protein